MNFEDCNTSAEITADQNPLSLFELAAEYQKLIKKHQEQNDQIEQYKQKIYTLSNAKKLHEEELQVIKESYDQEMVDANKKNSMHIKDLQNRLTEAKLTIGKLESENEQLKIDSKKANNHLQIQQSTQQNMCNKNEMVVSKERIEYLEKLEIDLVELKIELNQLRSEKSELSSKISQLQVKSVD